MPRASTSEAASNTRKRDRLGVRVDLEYGRSNPSRSNPVYGRSNLAYGRSNWDRASDARAATGADGQIAPARAARQVRPRQGRT